MVATQQPLPQPDVSHIMSRLEELKDRMDRLEAPATSTPERVFDFLEREFNIPIGVIISNDKHQKIKRARQFGYWLLCSCEGFTTTQTGIAFRKEHSTVISGLQAMKDIFYFEQHVEPKPFTDLLVKWNEYVKS